jgi:hypothetical protein
MTNPRAAHFPPFPSVPRLVAGLALLGALAACSSPGTTGASLPADAAFLADNEERFYSEIAGKDQRVSLRIELVDAVRPRQRVTVDGVECYAIPAGNRRVQFRIVLPSTGWNDSRAREARGFADVTLVAGHRYLVTGKYDQTKRAFRLLDKGTNQAVSPEVDVGFFAPVERSREYIPIFIPIKA